MITKTEFHLRLLEIPFLLDVESCSSAEIYLQMIFCQVTSISFLSKYISQSEMLIQHFSYSHLQSLQRLTASHTCQPENQKRELQRILELARPNEV